MRKELGKWSMVVKDVACVETAVKILQEIVGMQ